MSAPEDSGRSCAVNPRLEAMCFGEFFGTFLLVLFGVGTLAAAVLFKAHTGLLQVVVVWGAGVTLAIYATRHLSCAHLNPAVSLGMVLAALHFRFLLAPLLSGRNQAAARVSSPLVQTPRPSAETCPSGGPSATPEVG